MQQTEKYKLNLIEPSDPFLPEGLNANTQKMEDVMAAHEALVDGRVDSLDQRVTVLEAHKFAFGTYLGDSSNPRFVPLPFTPRYVFVRMMNPGTSKEQMAIAIDAPGGSTAAIEIADGGFLVKNNIYVALNGGPEYFGYAAFA